MDGVDEEKKKEQISSICQKVELDTLPLQRPVT